jgi:RNA polymerase primary sigma factor
MNRSYIIQNVEDINAYLKDIRKKPKLEDVRELQIRAALSAGGLTKERRDALLGELIEGNLRFVITTAKAYQGKGLDMGDLINEGNIGLIKAAERYDPAQNNVKFISYAVWWVKQSIMSAINEYARTIRLPSNIIQDEQKRKKERSKNNDCSFINYTNEESGTIPSCVGLFDSINEDGDQLIDVLKNNNAENPEDSLNTSEEIKKRVGLMLSVLDDREKIIIERSFGLTGSESNLEDLGEEFGCTKERIRQLRDKAIKKLRNDSYGLINYL